MRPPRAHSKEGILRRLGPTNLFAKKGCVASGYLVFCQQSGCLLGKYGQQRMPVTVLLEFAESRASAFGVMTKTPSEKQCLRVFIMLRYLQSESLEHCDTFAHVTEL